MEQKIRCPYCDFESVNIAGLKSHINSKHPEESEKIKSGEVSLEELLAKDEVPKDIIAKGSGIIEDQTIDMNNIADPKVAKNRVPNTRVLKPIKAICIKEHECEINKEQLKFVPGKLYVLDAMLQLVLGNARRPIFQKILTD